MKIVTPFWPESRRWMLLSIAMILGVGIVTYHLALRIGFWTDDYTFLDMAGRLTWSDYLAAYFDPRLQWHWYRPMQGIVWWIGYMLFHGEPLGYHLIQLGLHLANACLLFDLTARVTRRWQMALVAALVYVTLPVDDLAVLWVGVADPLVTLFYLLAIKLWIKYVEAPDSRQFVLSFIAFIGALMSKEIAVTLPATLFLADRWLIGKLATARQLIKRYVPFICVLALYGLFELNVLARGVFTTALGYGLGNHILFTLIHHLTTLAFPWRMPAPFEYAWLVGVIVLLGFAVVKRAPRILFLATAAILAMLPVLPFPSNIAFAPRYLYLPLIGSAVGAAAIIEGVRQRGARREWVSRGAAVALTLMIVWSGIAIAEDAVNFEGTARQVRLQFRSIFQSHASFPSDTFLYFINPPLETPYISGLFFLRYGANVQIGSTDQDEVVRLRTHNNTIVFYQDDDKAWQKQIVAKNLGANVIPILPVRFDDAISLETFELASATVKRGEAVVLILYWRASKKIEKDYTVFAHLIDRNGNIVAGIDAPPRQGALPTSAWRVNELVADGIVIPIDQDVPLGIYEMQVGLYFPPTMQRLAIADTRNAVSIAPVYVGE